MPGASQDSPTGLRIAAHHGTGFARIQLVEFSSSSIVDSIAGEIGAHHPGGSFRILLNSSLLSLELSFSPLARHAQILRSCPSLDRCPTLWIPSAIGLKSPWLFSVANSHATPSSADMDSIGGWDNQASRAQLIKSE